MYSGFQNLGRILGSIAHEVSGPIAVIQSCLQLQSFGSDDPNFKSMMECALEEQKAALGLVRTMSALAISPELLTHQEVVRSLGQYYEGTIGPLKHGGLTSIASYEATKGAWVILLTGIHNLFGVLPAVRSGLGIIWVEFSFRRDGGMVSWSEIQAILAGDDDSFVPKDVWLSIGLPLFILIDHCGLAVKLETSNLEEIGRIGFVAQKYV